MLGVPVRETLAHPFYLSQKVHGLLGEKMNWNPFKKKKEEPEALDPLSVTLSDLKKGYVLDYDLKTWQVTAQHYYDYEGDRVDEWELTCGDDMAYLERAEDDSISWVLTRKIPLSDIEGDIRGYMRDHDNEDPPDEVRCQGVMFYGISSAVGSFYKDGGDEEQEFIIWNYLDESEEHTLSIEQWAEDAFEAAVGEFVEEYQFSNILPSVASSQ